MSAIPLHDLDEVATKADIALVRSELANLRAELKTDIADLRSEMSDLRTELKSDIGALRTSFTGWMLTLLVVIIGAMVGIGFLA